MIPLVSGKPFIAVSIYARWFRPHPLTGKANNIHSDRSAHLIMPDLAAFIWDTDLSGHRTLVAGDLNNIYGATRSNPLVCASVNRLPVPSWWKAGACVEALVVPNTEPANHLTQPLGVGSGVHDRVLSLPAGGPSREWLPECRRGPEKPLRWSYRHG